MNKRRRLYLIVVLVLSMPCKAQPLVVGDFESGILTGWEPERFAGETIYLLTDIDGRQALKAHSDATASGLVRRLRIDLHETPYLNWSWRVENVLTGLDETTREGDDYSARVYVIHSGGLFFWRTHALSYVWSGTKPRGSFWFNAFTSNSVNVVVESGDARVGQWVSYKRNIQEDFRSLFGMDVKRIDAVAIMTDTDNSSGQATAYYGNIFFTAD